MITYPTKIKIITFIYSFMLQATNVRNFSCVDLKIIPQTILDMICSTKWYNLFKAEMVRGPVKVFGKPCSTTVYKKWIKRKDFSLLFQHNH